MPSSLWLEYRCICRNDDRCWHDSHQYHHHHHEYHDGCLHILISLRWTVMMGCFCGCVKRRTRVWVEEVISLSFLWFTYGDLFVAITTSTHYNNNDFRTCYISLLSTTLCTQACTYGTTRDLWCVVRSSDGRWGRICRIGIRKHFVVTTVSMTYMRSTGWRKDHTCVWWLSFVMESYSGGTTTVLWYTILVSLYIYILYIYIYIEREREKEYIYIYIYIYI